MENKEWFLSVPKICHVYWGGDRLIYMRYLTIKTFMEYNPDWKIVFWYPEKPFKGKSWNNGNSHTKWDQSTCKDYLPELLELDIIKVPVDFASLKIAHNMPEVHKNDYIRMNVLSLYGGVWSDMDIIYFKPITELEVNKPENKDKEVFVCITTHGHSTGFNMAKEGSCFFVSLLDLMQEEYNGNHYQCWGPDLWNKHFKKLESIPFSVNIEQDAVYAHNVYIVEELLQNKKMRFTKNSIGCHWYGGNPMWSDFFNKTKGGETNLPNNIIGNLIKNAK